MTTPAETTERLLVEDTARDGRWNMAFDESLLEAAVHRGQTALRVYRWNEPTISLGYFQKTPPPDLAPALAALPTIRRLSGGGAILHHHEWTYSCAVPKGHPLARRAEDLYEASHAALIEGFRQLGVAASLRGDVADRAGATFLCFRRRDPRDIVVAGHKVVGSAQRRRRGAVLQHGSVLLRRSELAPELPGLLDLAAVGSTNPMWGAREFVSNFGRQLFRDAPLLVPDAEDIHAAESLCRLGQSPVRGRAITGL